MPNAVDLRAKLLAMIEKQGLSRATVDVKALVEQREKLQKRTPFLVANLDEETLADAKPELERIKAQRR